MNETKTGKTGRAGAKRYATTSVLLGEAKRQALRLAERCDFSPVVATAIKNAAVSFYANTAHVGVECRDDIDRAQVITAFTYGAALAGMDFYSNKGEDFQIRNCDGRGKKVVTTSVKKVVTIILTAPEGR